MAKKPTFTETDAATYNAIGAKSAPSAKRTKGTKDTESTKEVRFTVVITEEQMNFLNEKKWRERKSFKEIMQDYIKADLKKHPDYIE